MKFLLLLLSFSALANEFRLKETGARFSLRITPNDVFYGSEALTKKIFVKDCNRKLAADLNTELFSKIPNSDSHEGFTLLIDKKEIKVPKESELAKTMFMMDARMMRFFAEEKSACP